MIDLHTHTQFSDGQLNPAEHIREAEVHGYTVIAITDHADASNVDIFIPALTLCR
jgi:histidinol phosphatase-like PHP family hydrolase